MSDPLFTLDKIDLRFGERQLLRGFSRQIHRSNKIIIEGKSGIGKSTLLRLLMGTARPDSGAIFYLGKRLNRHTVWQVRQEVAMVDQEPDLGDLTVKALYHTVLGYKANRHLGWDAELIDREMKWLELPENILVEPFPKLSGGEKQRVLILLALMLKREIFFLDEVTAALDGGLKRKVIDRFLNHPSWTVVAVSHDPGWAASKQAAIWTLEAS